MKVSRRLILGVLAVLAMALPASAQSNPCNPCGGKQVKAAGSEGATMGMTFYIDDPMNRNSITFKSEAPLEDIIGTTNQLTGYLMFDPADPSRGGSGELSIPVASLNTGIPMRDEHLHGADWLAAETYPNMTLKIENIGNVSKASSTKDAVTYTLTVNGELSMHGRTKNVTFPARITYLKENEMTRQRMPGDLLAARAEFAVSLADFGVTGPAGMGVIGSKVGETIDIAVSLMGSTQPSGMAQNPCNPSGGKQAANPCNPCGGKTVANPCGGK